MSAAGSISADGRYVAFQSTATNLVAGDTNGFCDIFVHDRQSGQTSRVSVNSTGAQADRCSFYPVISTDGRYVAFESYATNLVPGDTNGWEDVFVHDRQSGQTTRVSIDSSGIQANGWNAWASISADGRCVAFFGSATNLVPGDTNGQWDVFVHDRQNGETTRVSVSSAGVQGNNESHAPSISSDGRYVAFDSWATNLVPVDTNGNPDIFVHDRQSGQTTCASVDSMGIQANYWSDWAAISADGRFVAFVSHAGNLVTGDTNGVPDIFVHDCQTGLTTRASVDSTGLQADGWSDWVAVSADGRFVAFESDSTNLVPGDTNEWWDVFVHDRQSGETTRISVDSAGVQGNLNSYGFSISGDGRFVAFHSDATNLVPGDSNGCRDVFLRDRLAASAIFRTAGANPASHVAGSLPVLGTIYAAAVDLAGTTGHDLAWLVGYSTPITLPLGGGQVLLVDATDPHGELLLQPMLPGPLATFAIPVPADLAFLGFFAATQALHWGGGQPFALSNALDLFLGY
ncbi:MAG: hypothetical protein AB1726_16890 [Planctomycetota bacterium]